MCGSRKCPNHPHRRDWKFLVVGSQRTNPFKEMYEAQLEFPGGGGLMKMEAMKMVSEFLDQ